MGNIDTPWGLAGCAGAILLIALAVPTLGGAEPVPDRITPSVFAPDSGPAVASAAVTSSLVAASNQAIDRADHPPAAPAGETSASERLELAPRDTFVVAVGNNARNMCDPGFESGFTGAVPDLEVAFSCCNDRDAIELRMVNRVDMTLLGGTLSQREQAAGLRQTRIGLELFALAVAVDFPLESLSRSQMRQLLTGEVRDWQQLGCDRGSVVIVTPAERTLALRAARSLILGDSFAAGAIRVADERHVADQILRNPGALAVVRVTRTPPMGVKLLQIDWTPPTADAFGFGTYPYGLPLHVVTSGRPEASVAKFLEYAGSPAGQEALGRTLLVP